MVFSRGRPNNSNDDQASHSDEVSEEEKESWLCSKDEFLELDAEVTHQNRKKKCAKEKEECTNRRCSERASRNRKGTAGDRERTT